MKAKLFTSTRFWIGATISLLCLWLAVRDVPFAEFGVALASARYEWLLPAITFQALAVIARARRWTVILGKNHHLADSFWAQGIGYLFTNVFPLRLGEPTRVIVMAERCRLPVVQVAASAILERLLDMATILLVLALVLPLMQVPPLVSQAGLSFGVLILLAPVALALAIRFRQAVERLLQNTCEWCKFLPANSVAARWRELVSGFRPLMRWQTSLESIGWSIVTWVLSIAMYWCVLRAFQADSSLLEAAFVVVALSLAVTVPSSPGFIGVFQLVGQQALTLPFASKYDAASALAIILTAHLTYYLLTTVLGLLGMWRLGKSFAHLGRVFATGRSVARTTSQESVS